MRAAVLGYPIEHSLSPALHNAAYEALGLDWKYEAIPCREADLPGLLRTHREWGGFSCTMPLKRAAFEAANIKTDTARAVRAANTLIPNDDDWWTAHNTDVDGILGALGPDVRGSVTVLGAGGTAQAVVAALDRLGIRRFSLLVRDASRSAEVAATANGLNVGVDVEILRPDAPDLRADVVVSTLPAGAADVLAGWAWRPDQTLLDVVYAPWPTELAAAAERAGATVIGGAEMLLHQAARQVTLMTGCEAPIEAMRAALG